MTGKAASVRLTVVSIFALAMVAIATGAISNGKETPYIGLCTEEHYEEWYYSDYPEECRERFANASNLHSLFGIYCDPFCGDIYFDYLDDCGSAGMVLTIFYRTLCAINEKGVACYNYLTSDDVYNPKPEVNQYCVDVNTTTCTTNCFYALEAFATELGCCVNTVYNMSVPDPATAYQLWDTCDIATPSYCGDIKFDLVSSASLASNLSVLSVTLMLLLMAAMK